MITKTQLWAAIAARYPDEEDLTAHGLRQMFETIWGAAHAAGFENGKAWQQMQKATSIRPIPFK